MKIIALSISNYRNLDGITIAFSGDCDFIVGENNLGKSNILWLMNVMFNARGFKYEDFSDTETPIEIRIRLQLAPRELGHFQDLFDADDHSKVNIIAKQSDGEENLVFYHAESGTYIPQVLIRCINFVYYDSLRNPISEINFDKGKGVGKFLRNIISKYLVDHSLTDSAFLDEAKISALLCAINSKISKIKSFKDFEITATHDRNIENLLSKVVTLEDAKGDSLSRAGYGVQFLILVTLSILDNIQLIRQRRGDRGIFDDERTGTKAISLVMGLDEPEIHLHPYMQRSLVKYLNSIISNTNEDFKLLVKELFNIDSFIGQVTIATHSPAIVLDNYKQIIRLFKENGVTGVRSGADISLTASQEKHLLMQLPYVKEAFFARVVILIEGETEFASIPLFAEKLDINFDEYGIAIIQSRGGGGLDPLYDLLTLFAVPVIAIRDKDSNTTSPTKPNFYQTEKRDFEEELIRLIDHGKEHLLRNILIEFDNQGETVQMQTGALNNIASRYGLNLQTFTTGLRISDVASHETDSLKCFYLTWLDKRKSHPLGNLIGQSLSAEEIPMIYKSIIQQAKLLSEHE